MQQDVNYIEHLKNVNAKFYDDRLITSSHVAIYNSLFQFWNKSFFDTELSINRDSVMKQAKIGSVNTYLKCLKELEMQKYLKYIPSHNPLIGSIVNLFRFDTTSDIVVIKSHTSSGITPDKALIPYINIKTLKPKTLKLIHENASLIEQCLEGWILEHTKTENNDFEKAWEAYGKKGNKKNAQKRWEKVTTKDFENIMNHIPIYVKSVSDRKYLKDFEGYLNQEHWKSIVTPIIINGQKEHKSTPISSPQYHTPGEKLR